VFFGKTVIYSTGRIFYYEDFYMAGIFDLFLINFSRYYSRLFRTQKS